MHGCTDCHVASVAVSRTGRSVRIYCPEYPDPLRYSSRTPTGRPQFTCANIDLTTPAPPRFGSRCTHARQARTDDRRALAGRASAVPRESPLPQAISLLRCSAPARSPYSGTCAGGSPAAWPQGFARTGSMNPSVCANCARDALYQGSRPARSKYPPAGPSGPRVASRMMASVPSVTDWVPLLPFRSVAV